MAELMEDITVLIERSQAGDRQSRDELIRGNLGLVRHIVRRFTGRGQDPEDLFQIGVIGLIKAIDKFDLRVGVKFSTYAVPVIAGEIKRFLRDDGMMKVSRTVKENGMKIGVARQRLQGTLNREPGISEIARETGLSREEVVLAMEAGLQVESLYAASYQEEGTELSLADRVVRGEEGAVGRNLGGSLWPEGDKEKEALLDRMLLKQLLDGLEERERRLIFLRYFQDKTQVQVAEILGVSQVQVSRLEKKILLQMREKVF